MKPNPDLLPDSEVQRYLDCIQESGTAAVHHMAGLLRLHIWAMSKPIILDSMEGATTQETLEQNCKAAFEVPAGVKRMEQALVDPPNVQSNAMPPELSDIHDLPEPIVQELIRRALINGWEYTSDRSLGRGLMLEDDVSKHWAAQWKSYDNPMAEHPKRGPQISVPHWLARRMWELKQLPDDFRIETEPMIDERTPLYTRGPETLMSEGARQIVADLDDLLRKGTPQPFQTSTPQALDPDAPAVQTTFLEHSTPFTGFRLPVDTGVNSQISLSSAVTSNQPHSKESNMGVQANIDRTNFPKQGDWLHKRTTVCFKYDTSKTIEGTIVRNDREEPGITIIRLDDGRYVLTTECQHTQPR